MAVVEATDTCHVSFFTPKALHTVAQGQKTGASGECFRHPGYSWQTMFVVRGKALRTVVRVRGRNGTRFDCGLGDVCSLHGADCSAAGTNVILT